MLGLDKKKPSHYSVQQPWVSREEGVSPAVVSALVWTLQPYNWGQSTFNALKTPLAKARRVQVLVDSTEELIAGPDI